MSNNLEQIWSQVQRALASAVDEPTYRTWLEPLRLREIVGEKLVVDASPQACGWVSERFGRLLQSCAAAALESKVTVEVLRGETRATTWQPASAPSPRGAANGPARGTASRAGGTARESPTQPERLSNPQLTFEQFIIGDSNRLAHAAALAVAELPSLAYNPLFICGPPGVGKTHLLHSIANLTLEHSPGLSIRITTGEAFTNEFQLALASSRMDGFKARFRRVDVLLIDDVQFLERKTRTEEEFFHTFNTLHEAGSQLVLTSDRPPRDLQALEDRLRERFEAGLVADIHPPDAGTRLTILRKRALQEELSLPDQGALEVIAERVTLNVRALEGALIRVVAFGSLTGRPLSAKLASEVLDNLYPHTKSKPRSLAEIQTAACEHFSLSPEELLSPSRTTRVAWPRQVAMYLARELTGESLLTIGKHFGGRDHTTVLHALRRTEARVLSDAACKETVDTLRKRLTQSSH